MENIQININLIKHENTARRRIEKKNTSIKTHLKEKRPDNQEHIEKLQRIHEIIRSYNTKQLPEIERIRIFTAEPEQTEIAQHDKQNGKKTHTQYQT